MNVDSLSKSSLILDTSDIFLSKQFSFFIKNCRKSVFFADLKDCTLDQNISTFFSAQSAQMCLPIQANMSYEQALSHTVLWWL